MSQYGATAGVACALQFMARCSSRASGNITAAKAPGAATADHLREVGGTSTALERANAHLVSIY